MYSSGHEVKRFAQRSGYRIINCSTNHCALAQKFYWRLLRFGFEFRMFKGALFLALGFFAVCFPVVAQQAKHSRAVQHRVAASALMPLDVVSNFSIYRPNVISASNASFYFTTDRCALGQTVRNW